MCSSHRCRIGVRDDPSIRIVDFELARSRHDTHASYFSKAGGSRSHRVEEAEVLHTVEVVEVE
jgi:hypothetical protein